MGRRVIGFTKPPEVSHVYIIEYLVITAYTELAINGPTFLNICLLVAASQIIVGTRGWNGEPCTNLTPEFVPFLTSQRSSLVLIRAFRFASNPATRFPKAVHSFFNAHNSVQE